MSEQKRYAYGNGMPGCLFDHSSGPYESVASAASAASELLELTADETAELERDCLIYFRGERASEVGAGMVEIFEVDSDWRGDCE